MIEAIRDKKTLRDRLRQTMLALDPEQIRQRSLRAAEKLTASREYRQASTLMIFLPLRDEIDARSIAQRAWQDGKTVCVPLVSASQKHMIPLVIQSLDEPMEVNRLGVRAPSRGEPYPIEMIDLVVTPGLGFDLDGNRLGRGGGYYDRFLAHPDFRGKTCGFALEEQILQRVPTDEHDVRVDLLVTDRRVVRFPTG